MTIRVELDDPFAYRVNGERSAVVEACGPTLRDVFEDLDRKYPGLRTDICGGAGDLPRSSARVSVNGTLTDDLGTEVPDGSAIWVFRVDAGG